MRPGGHLVAEAVFEELAHGVGELPATEPPTARADLTDERHLFRDEPWPSNFARPLESV